VEVSPESGCKLYETALLSNSLGTKTNEVNCYHSSHFHR
jgi:hypothetical protein